MNDRLVSRYYHDTDSQLFYLDTASKVIESEEIALGIIVGYNVNNKIIEVEFLGINQITVNSLKKLSESISSKDMKFIMEYLI